MKKRKSMIFMVVLMCLFVVCAINATSVNAKTKQSALEKKTTNTKIGTYEIVLGKYDTLAKGGRPIYVKGKNAVKKKIGYARGGIYYIYNKNIVYVNKSYILCKTNILTKKTKKIMNCKKYTIADSFYNGKMILYSGDSLKTVNVKNNIITEIVKNPCIQSSTFPAAILFDSNKIYYGKEKDGKTSIVELNTVDKQIKEIPLKEGESVIKIVKKSSDIYWNTVTNKLPELLSDYNVIKTSERIFDKYQVVVENAKLINVIDNKVIYEYIPADNQCKSVNQYDISSKKEMTLIQSEDFPFAPYMITAAKKGRSIKITLISQSDESAPDKVIYQMTKGKRAVIKEIYTSNKTIPNNYFKGMKNIKKIYFQRTVKKLHKQSLRGLNQKTIIYVKKRDYKQTKKMIRKINRKVKVRVVA